VCQFLHMFHTAFALEDFATEDLEQAMVDPGSIGFLVDLQARMLRTLTQDKRVSFDNWIKYIQKEFEARLPDQNPWLEEDAYNYESFTLTTKLMILSNLCEWQLDDPERFRANVKAEEDVAVDWRVDPIGYDALDRTYWLFDDNRLFRENPLPKKNTASNKQQQQAAAKKAAASAPPPPRRGTRRSERGRNGSVSQEQEPGFETPPITPGVQWEPVCITREEWTDFANLFKRSKHPDEKALHILINSDILPKVLEDFKEKEKEQEKIEALANRKRSSRIVIRGLEQQEKARLETIRQQEQAAAAEVRRKEMRGRREEKASLASIERATQQQSRDNRLKDREERLKAREKAIWDRERKKKAQQQRTAKEREARINRRLNGDHSAEDLTEDEHPPHNDGQDEDDEGEEEDWVFDCVCGVHGNNLDDGELMIACGKCNVWQHVACLKQEYKQQGLKAVDWETVDYVCSRCTEKEQRIKAQKRKEQKLRAAAAAAAAQNAAQNALPQQGHHPVDHASASAPTYKSGPNANGHHALPSYPQSKPTPHAAQAYPPPSSGAPYAPQQGPYRHPQPLQSPPLQATHHYRHPSPYGQGPNMQISQGGQPFYNNRRSIPPLSPSSPPPQHHHRPLSPDQYSHPSYSNQPYSQASPASTTYNMGSPRGAEATGQYPSYPAYSAPALTPAPTTHAQHPQHQHQHQHPHHPYSAPYNQSSCPPPALSGYGSSAGIGYNQSGLGSGPYPPAPLQRHQPVPHHANKSLRSEFVSSAQGGVYGGGVPLSEEGSAAMEGVERTPTQLNNGSNNVHS
ncbi:hypothetical protein BGW38_004814, partial [Lunasporangiospora selenospora]